MKILKSLTGALMVSAVLGGAAMAAPAKSPIERYVIDADKSERVQPAERCSRMVMPNRARPPFIRDANCKGRPNFVKLQADEAEKGYSR